MNVQRKQSDSLSDGTEEILAEDAWLIKRWDKLVRGMAIIKE